MSAVIAILKPSDEPAWQAYVNSRPDTTIYHALEWRDILYNEYKFEPVYLMAKKMDEVVGVLPMSLVRNLRGKRLVSLPFSIYGGPIGDTDEVVSALLSKAVGMVQGSKAASLEIKPHTSVSAEFGGLIASDWGIGTTIDLTVGVDVLWKGLTDRNDVNRAVREGLKFILSDVEGIDRFYILQLMTRKRLGLPTPSLRYYRSFFENMRGLVKLALVEKEGIPVAAGVFFTYKGTVLYALGASDRRYLDCRPNDLLIWEMAKWSASTGYEELDLGPTPLSDKGLLHFKRKWGGKEIPYGQYFYPSASHKATSSEGSGLFRVMPLGVAEHIGPIVIRCLG